VTKHSSPPPLPINTAANPIPDFEADAVLDGAFPSEPLTVVTPRPDYAADALDTPPRRNVPAALVAAAAVGVLVLVGVVLVIAWPRGESSPDSAAAGAEKPAATEWPEVGVKPLIEPDLSAMPELPATPVATPAQLDKLQTRSLLGATRAADGAKRAIKRLIRAGKPKDPKQGNGSNTTTPDIWNIKHN